MKLVMGYAQSKEGKRHLVDADDLAVSLCGVYIPHDKLLRTLSGELILFADHWQNGACGPTKNNCLHCEGQAGLL